MMPKERLEEFLAGLNDPAIAKIISDKTSMSFDKALTDFVKYKNEAFLALRVTEKHLAKDKRILEVGSGAGIFAFFLLKEGYDITALEPGGLGYGFMASAFQAMQETNPDLALPFLAIGAEELDPADHGSFDFIFSIQVLQHVPSISATFDGMNRVLRDDGEMMHICTNYHFPYDPHFRIPLIPFFPQLTHLLLPKKIKKSELWRSLNFINYSKVKGVTKKLGYELNLQPSLLNEMLSRLQTDEEFSKRHGVGLTAIILSVFNKTGIIRLIKKLPACAASPMMFHLVKE